jgi:hypothetical protein
VLFAWSRNTVHDYRVALFSDHTFSYDISEWGKKKLYGGHYTLTPNTTKQGRDYPLAAA